MKPRKNPTKGPDSTFEGLVRSVGAPDPQETALLRPPEAQEAFSQVLPGQVPHALRRRIDPLMPEILTPEQLQRKIEEMGRKSGRRPPRKPPRKPPPAAADELWPGGPGVGTNDIRIARRGGSRRRARIV